METAGTRLAELNVRHTRRHMPTRRVALDPSYLPTAGGAAGSDLLAAVVAEFAPRIDAETRLRVPRLLRRVAERACLTSAARASRPAMGIPRPRVSEPGDVRSGTDDGRSRGRALTRPRRRDPTPGRVSLIAATEKGDLVYRGRTPDAPQLAGAAPTTTGSVAASAGVLFIFQLPAMSFLRVVMLRGN